MKYSDELTGLSDRELLEVIFGAQAEDVLEGCGGSLSTILQSTRILYTPENRRLHAGAEIARRATLEALKKERVSSPRQAIDYLKLHFLAKHYEAFVVVWLDVQNQVLDVSEMFRGTITQTSVYPREVAKAAMERNAVSIIIAHNHPSGVAVPSAADKHLTAALKTCLAVLDVRVADHIIVAGSGSYSFAENGIL